MVEMQHLLQQLFGGSTIVFNDVGDSVILIYNTTGGWSVLSNNGTTIS